MLPILLDKGLPWRVASALREVGFSAAAVGHDEDAPPEDASDDENCAWCSQNQAVFVTNDRGKGDRLVLEAIAAHRVHAIFVYNDLRTAHPSHLLRALLWAEEEIDRLASGRKPIRHRLRPKGGLEKRG